MWKSQLPNAVGVAALVSSVTEPMCDAHFVVDDPLSRGESLCDQMFMIALKGDREIMVVLSCDTHGSRALGSAFMKCPEEKLTRGMSEEVIAELLNMVAGRISESMSFSHTVGLPRRTDLAEITAGPGFALEEAITLRSEGKMALRLWIIESQPNADADEQDPPKRKRRDSALRTLLRRIVPFNYPRND
jgi:hypothetical protein